VYVDIAVKNLKHDRIVPGGAAMPANNERIVNGVTVLGQ
jgi:hypothetical protein